MEEVIKRNPESRGACAGREMADALINWIHLMYQKDTALRVLDFLIARLKERRGEFVR